MEPTLNLLCTKEEIQIDFGGPIPNKRDQDIHLPAYIVCFDKYPTLEVSKQANGLEVNKYLDDYDRIHEVP